MAFWWPMNICLDDGRIKVQADLVLADQPDIDICIAPPLLGAVSDAVLSNRELIDWLSRHHREGGEVASLCMGAALLAAGGVLSFLGLLYLVGQGDMLSVFQHGIHVGDGLMLLAAMSYALYGVLLRHWKVPVPAWQSTLRWT
ncbi:hypothetical protein G6F31_018208 [Rhizopus arrhizus]|nr:hypothetical protein G6F31_018208 [Rhizopus arrhizus]